MHQPCSPCAQPDLDQPDLLLLRLVLIGKRSVPMSQPALPPLALDRGARRLRAYAHRCLSLLGLLPKADRSGSPAPQVCVPVIFSMNHAILPALFCSF